MEYLTSTPALSQGEEFSEQYGAQRRCVHDPLNKAIAPHPEPLPIEGMWRCYDYESSKIYRMTKHALYDGKRYTYLCE